MKITNRMIAGSALSMAAFLVAIDHTRNPVPTVTGSGFASQTQCKKNPCSLQTSSSSLSHTQSTVTDECEDGKKTNL